MRSFFQTLYYVIKRILSYIPTRLPVGVAEFESWSDSIIELSGPLADSDSMRFVLANQILTLKPGYATIPKNDCVRFLQKAAANQVASAVFQELKNKQEQRIAAVTAAQPPVEATTHPDAASTDGKI